MESNSDREKAALEKDELSKTIVKLQSRDVQYLHELKNKENLYKKLQEQLKKINEKNINVPYRNTFEITNTLESKGPVLFAGNVFYLAQLYNELEW